MLNTYYILVSNKATYLNWIKEAKKVKSEFLLTE